MSTEPVALPIVLLDAGRPDDIRERGRRRINVAEHYAIPLLSRDELLAYAGWHGEVVDARSSRP